MQRNMKANTRKRKKKKGEEGERINIKQMFVRSAIRQGFRLLELGLLAVGGALLGIKISFN